MPRRLETSPKDLMSPRSSSRRSLGFHPEPRRGTSFLCLVIRRQWLPSRIAFDGGALLLLDVSPAASSLGFHPEPKRGMSFLDFVIRRQSLLSQVVFDGGALV